MTPLKNQFVDLKNLFFFYKWNDSTIPFASHQQNSQGPPRKKLSGLMQRALC